MQCPKCESNMSTVTVGDVDVDRCDSCKGIWLDALEYDKLKNMKDDGKLVDTGDENVGKMHDHERDIKCPKCNTMMVGMTFHDQPHIQYEMCSMCGGMYLDAGEFKDSVEFTFSEHIRAMLKPGH
ncbi:zf-TFIIB domain-containing protein [Planctomycetota bacterium]|nr:zf-TFIIB domain-containing protein [Planctomycetota bacterium]